MNRLKRISTMTIIATNFALFLSPGSTLAEEKIVGGGSGSLTDEIVDAAKAYMTKNPDAITLGEPQGLTKRFLDFINTPEGQKIIASRGAFGLR